MYNKLFEQRCLFCTTSRCSEKCDYMKMGLPKIIPAVFSGMEKMECVCNLRQTL
jgi:hypothetical protein